jgi:hypothetical protein
MQEVRSIKARWLSPISDDVWYLELGAVDGKPLFTAIIRSEQLQSYNAFRFAMALDYACSVLLPEVESAGSPAQRRTAWYQLLARCHSQEREYERWNAMKPRRTKQSCRRGQRQPRKEPEP